jgi:hypothetical protein
VTGIRGRRRKQVRDDLKETRGSWKMEQEAPDRTLWMTCCGRRGSVARDCGMSALIVDRLNHYVAGAGRAHLVQ